MGWTLSAPPGLAGLNKVHGRNALALRENRRVY